MKTGLGRGHRRSFGSRQAQPTPLPLQAFVFLPFSKDINLLSILNNHPAVFRHPAHFSPFLHPCWEQTNLFLSAIFFFLHTQGLLLWPSHNLSCFKIKFPQSFYPFPKSYCSWNLQLPSLTSSGPFPACPQSSWSRSPTKGHAEYAICTENEGLVSNYYLPP